MLMDTSIEYMCQIKQYDRFILAHTYCIYIKYFRWFPLHLPQPKQMFMQNLTTYNVKVNYFAIDTVLVTEYKDIKFWELNMKKQINSVSK